MEQLSTTLIADNDKPVYEDICAASPHLLAHREE